MASHHKESGHNKVVSDFNVSDVGGRLPSKRISTMLTKSVIEKIAKEVSKITSERRNFDDVLSDRRRRVRIASSPISIKVAKEADAPIF